MMLVILDREPWEAALKVPDKIKFKQLLELCQLICSTSISNVYKPVNQGKELAKWIYNHKVWTMEYFRTLFVWCNNNVNMKSKTKNDIAWIYHDLINYRKTNADFKASKPEYAIFRYTQDYKGSKYASKTALAIDDAIVEYEKYKQWKGKKWGV